MNMSKVNKMQHITSIIMAKIKIYIYTSVKTKNDSEISMENEIEQKNEEIGTIIVLATHI